MVKIYTKKGDDGQTSLRQGLRVSKDDIRIETNGEIDELNSIIGVVTALLGEDHEQKEELQDIQTHLMRIMSVIAIPVGNPGNDLSLIKATAQLEHRIDELSDDKKFHFVLPGGTLLSACMHLARSHTRTCERRLWTLNRSFPIDQSILKYMNRLSDYFFALALYMK
jgi:cob(I)alamin adenosyltransferase